MLFLWGGGDTLYNDISKNYFNTKNSTTCSERKSDKVASMDIVFKNAYCIYKLACYSVDV